MNSETALITGSSSGIGLHLAHEFASHAHPLVLVAPVESELQSIAADIISIHKVNVRVFARDLEQPNAAQETFDALEGDGVSIDILINNAGHGFRGKWWEIPIEGDISMVRLNIEAVLRLTKLFLPPMLKRERGRLLNTASIAGFEPAPATLCLSCDESLCTFMERGACRGTGGYPISVTALCPGATDTDFFPKAGMMATRAFQGIAPIEVAKAGYEGLMKKELFVVPGGMNKALVAARRFLSERA